MLPTRILAQEPRDRELEPGQPEREARYIESEKDDENDEAGEICAGRNVDADERDVVVDGEQRSHRSMARLQG